MCGTGLPVPLQGTRGGTSQDMTWYVDLIGSFETVNMRIWLLVTKDQNSKFPIDRPFSELLTSTFRSGTSQPCCFLFTLPTSPEAWSPRGFSGHRRGKRHKKRQAEPRRPCRSQLQGQCQHGQGRPRPSRGGWRSLLGRATEEADGTKSEGRATGRNYFVCLPMYVCM